MSEAKSFRKQVLALLGETYGDKTLVLCPTVFVRLLGGDHKAAILLSQILYWSDKTRDPDGWFYKSYANWTTETGLSEAQVRRIVNGDPRVKGTQVTLRDLGVETLLRKVRHTGAPTLHYRINQALFLDHLHTIFEQGDSSQCAESTPRTVEDESFTESGINPEQCEPSSDPQTSAKISSEETPSQSSDDDLQLCKSYEDRFGKLKHRLQGTFRNEQERLGAERVGEVLERCAVRGRSWHYVLKALANEATPDILLERVAERRWEGADALYSGERLPQPQAPEKAPVPGSERVLTPWGNALQPGATVADAWEAAVQQMALQFDQMTVVRCLEGLTLVDFEPETNTFRALAPTAYAQAMLAGRLKRSVERIVSDVYGQPVDVRCLIEEEWRGGSEDQIA